MPAKRRKKRQRPEDMLLRVIRVAEILVSVQDETPEGSVLVAQTDISTVRAQKTQTQRFDVG